MKRIMVSCLILVLIGCVSLWGYNRGHSDKPNDPGLKRNIKPKFGKATARDEEGTLKTEAYIRVDVDYPGENWYTDIRRLFGIDYEAKAIAKAKFGWSRSGYYSISAGANTSYPNYKGDEWNRSARETVRDDRFVDHDGRAATALLDMDEDDIETELDTCSANASINQDANSSAGTPRYQSTADAY